MTPTKQALRLLHEGTLALAEVEANGMRIDVDYLNQQQQVVDETIRTLQIEMEQDPVADVWHETFGPKTNFGSSRQLATILFDKLGIKSTVKTPKNAPSVKSEVLEEIDLPFIQKRRRIERLKKLKNTYIKGILREVTSDGLLHPSFDLNTTRSYRSSSSQPNFQNIPIRDPEIGQIIRTAFVPRSRQYIFVEVDYAAIEVRIAACYHKDETMIRYIQEDYDMHRDMAAECYLLDEVPKDVRRTAKTFTFGQFYGDYYVNQAKLLWREIKTQNLKTKDGVPLREHLAQKGITELGRCDPQQPPRVGTFENNIKHVEARFWNERFPQYRDWKEAWWKRYCQKGWFKSKTGFVYQGHYRRNEVVNLPIQGAAFHCTLLSLIKLVKRMAKMQSKIVGQIHDSIIIDVHRTELAAVLDLVQTVMCDEVCRIWKWIIVPLAIEIEGADRNWAQKSEIRIA